MQLDLTMTESKLRTLKEKLQHIKTVTLIKAMQETKMYGENGDFSENAEYQIAKGRLRGLLRQMDELNYQINHATIIQTTTDTNTVQIGHTVTLQTPVGEKQFQILGSTETNPNGGVISFKSPLGEALLGQPVGSTVTVKAGERTIEYKIIAIS